MRRRWAALCLLVCACETVQPTQVLVRFEADEESLQHVVQMRVRVWSDETDIRYDETRSVRDPADVTFPTTIPVVPRSGDAERAFRIVGTLLDRDGFLILRQEARAGFVENEVREVRLRFERACDRCAGGWTCYEGRCIEACFAPTRPGRVERSEPVSCKGPGRCECICEADSCSDGRCAPTSAGATVKIGVGAAHLCSLTADGAVHCSGANARGQLGLGDTMSRDTPDTVALRDGAKDIDIGRRHGCAVLRDGSLWCWGDNEAGQLGAPDGQMATSPVRVGTENDWTQVGAGGGHTCGLRAGGELYCWGNDEQGQLGDGTLAAPGSRAERVRVGDSYWRAVALGRAHTCAIRAADDSLWCWGANGSGRLGIGRDAADEELPGPRPLGGAPARWQRVSTGPSHTCGIATDGSLWCWGNANDGRLGFGGSEDAYVPRMHTVRERWRSVGTGGAHTCAVDEGGRRWCWGRNRSGELGLRGQGSADVGVPTLGPRPGWAEVAAGDGATCGILTDRALRCWGRNSSGSLGIGSDGEQPLPRRVCFGAEPEGS